MSNTVTEYSVIAYIFKNGSGNLERKSIVQKKHFQCHLCFLCEVGGCVCCIKVLISLSCGVFSSFLKCFTGVVLQKTMLPFSPLPSIPLSSLSLYFFIFFFLRNDMLTYRSSNLVNKAGSYLNYVVCSLGDGQIHFTLFCS